MKWITSGYPTTITEIPATIGPPNEASNRHNEGGASSLPARHPALLRYDRRACLRLQWLGFQSFERQHQALATLAAEQRDADLEALASDCKAYCPLSMSTSTLPATRAQKLVALEAIG